MSSRKIVIGAIAVTLLALVGVVSYMIFSKSSSSASVEEKAAEAAKSKFENLDGAYVKLNITSGVNANFTGYYASIVNSVEETRKYDAVTFQPMRKMKKVTVTGLDRSEFIIVSRGFGSSFSDFSDFVKSSSNQTYMAYAFGSVALLGAFYLMFQFMAVGAIETAMSSAVSSAMVSAA